MRSAGMTSNNPGFQALPGATPENSAFIDLYYDPAVTFIWGNTLSFSINDGQMRLSAGQSVRIAVPPGLVRVVAQVLTLSFIAPKPQLDFVVYSGQVVPVFYRASRFKNNPGSLTFRRLEGLSPSERNDLTTMKIMFAVILGMMILTAIPMALIFWFLNSLGAP
ncbi:hypothetical protein [uncultured Actinomyces sp.]|nr:hypothetical protein [uncultured Actinomyces sp.]